MLFLSDMHRTFPDNVLFQSKAEPSLQSALFNVLLAYGHHNKEVGYCQVRKAHTFSSHCLPEEQDQLVLYSFKYKQPTCPFLCNILIPLPVQQTVLLKLKY